MAERTPDTSSQRPSAGTNEPCGSSQSPSPPPLSPLTSPHRCLTRRQQFRLECQADGSVTVTSVSALNPTKVQLSAGGFQLLNQGELTFSWCRFSDLLVAG